MLRVQHLLVAVLFLGFSTVGCGKSGPEVVPVSGVITYQGEPLAKAFMEFLPDEGRASWAQSDENGEFELHYRKGQMGARTGTHSVTVSFRAASMDDEIARQQGKLKPHPDEETILEKYGANGSDPIRVEIPERMDDLEIKLE